MGMRLLALLALVSASSGCAHASNSPHAAVQGQANSAVASTPLDSSRHDGPPVKTAKEECEDLMNAVVPFARQMLTQHREFYPFGGAIAADGKIVAVGGHTGDEHPAAKDVIALLENGFKEAAKGGKYRATALVMDMLVVPPGRDAKQDAIAVRLDHRDGYSAVVVFPYTIGAAGDVTIEAPYAVKGEQQIFAR